jgi:hypothetical protein
LKTAINRQLDEGHPEALQPILQEYSQKYPRIAGMEILHRDLDAYIDIQRAARTKDITALIGLLQKIDFSTPPFQEHFRRFAENELPPADLLKQYKEVSDAWQQGDQAKAISTLQGLTGSAWGDVASQQLAHKRTVIVDFERLNKDRGTEGYDERLLAFYGELDPTEDRYYIQAIEPDFRIHKDKAIGRADELLSRARNLWDTYRENGAIGGFRRLESRISDEFRSQAHLLSEAHADAQRGMRVYKLLKTDPSTQWGNLQSDIDAEVQLQRRSLEELRMVLEPTLLNAKLALIGKPETGRDEK